MNFDELLEKASTTGDLSRVTELAEEAQKLQDEIEALEGRLKILKDEQNEILRKRLPDMFDEVGLEELKLRDGTRFIIKPFVSGSIPKGEFEREAALQWLEQNGGEHIITATVELAFGKSELERAKALAEELVAEGYEPSTGLGVHPSRLHAFARERQAAGEELPEKLLGLHLGRYAKVIK